jgi:hypothetical protein
MIRVTPVSATVPLLIGWLWEWFVPSVRSIELDVTVTATVSSSSSANGVYQAGWPAGLQVASGHDYPQHLRVSRASHGDTGNMMQAARVLAP